MVMYRTDRWRDKTHNEVSVSQQCAQCAIQALKSLSTYLSIFSYLFIKQVSESQNYLMQSSPHHQNAGEYHAAVQVSCSSCVSRRHPSNNRYIKAYGLVHVVSHLMKPELEKGF